MAKKKLTERLEIRLSEYEKNFIKGLADIYAHGNLSLFIVYSCLNSERKFLTKDDLHESDRSIRKGRQKASPDIPSK